MGSTKTSNEIRKAEREAHPGLSRFRIFHKEGKKQVADLYFWAKDEEEANHMLELWKKNEKCAKAGVKYFYGDAFGFISQNDDGTETAYDTMDEMHEAWRREHSVKVKEISKQVSEEVKHEKRVVADFKNFVDNYDPRHGVPKLKRSQVAQNANDPCGRAESIYSDFKYFFDHYDSTSSMSHQRGEHWSLDMFILEALRFNLPLLIKQKMGIPNEYCVEAIKQIHGKKPGFDVDKWYAAHNYSCSNKEFKLAEKLWNAELEKLLRAVKTYDYYMEHGKPNIKNDPLMKEIKKELDRTFPYKLGTDHEIDYKALEVLTDAAWDNIWVIWTKIGRNCWD